VRTATFLLLFAATPALAAPAAGQLRFIACPIYRDADSGKKSGCWLADDRESGARYDVSQAPVKPDWNHEVLVEGQVSKDQTDVCGGVVLDPVRVSILEGSCTRHMLPAEGYTGRKFVLPARNLRPIDAPRPAFAQPYGERVFAVPFDFGKAFVTYQLGDYLMDEAVAYVRASKAARIEITGFAATKPAQVSGRPLAESLSVAQARAEAAADWLRRLDLPMDRVTVRWRGDAEPADMAGADGLVEPSRRRVEIRVIP
jgi:outer membrane protein OmpA-like peptidoglycan-associated protein